MLWRPAEAGKVVVAAPKFSQRTTIDKDQLKQIKLRQIPFPIDPIICSPQELSKMLPFECIVPCDVGAGTETEYIPIFHYHHYLMFFNVVFAVDRRFRSTSLLQ